MLGELPPAHLLADRSYDAGPVSLAARGTYAIISPRCKRYCPCLYYPVRYAQRQAIERLFSRLKRQFAARYDKPNKHWLALTHMAATMVWLRHC